MKRIISLMSALSMLLLALASTASGAAPQLINFQGRLTNPGGTPVPDATYSVTFTIYDADMGGNTKWTELQSVTTTNGEFGILLGSVMPIEDTVFNVPARYLEIQIAPDPPIMPRTRLVTVPWAFRVATVDGATGGELFGDVSIQSDLTVSGKATIGPGHTNTGINSFVAGQNNTVTGGSATAGGGSGNTVSGEFAMVGGGSNNTASGDGATVGGGGSFNIASGFASTIAGGSSSTASGQQATVGGGEGNIASGERATAGGGDGNTASGEQATVGGGILNTASGKDATAGGGNNNTASGDQATVGGGTQNTASGLYSTVSGGVINIASGSRSLVAGGASNKATGEFSAALGGRNNEAKARDSFAAGFNTRASHDGAVVIAAASSNVGADSIASSGTEQMVLRADGHFYLTDGSGIASIPAGRFLNTSTGAYLSTGGTWTNSSDKTQKENFTPVDGKELLARLAALPITRWNYRAEGDNIKHIGPNAQDFYALFGLGNGEKSISTIDPSGIALAAIQALHEKTTALEERTEEMDKLKSQLSQLQTLVETLLADRSNGGSDLTIIQ